MTRRTRRDREGREVALGDETAGIFLWSDPESAPIRGRDEWAERARRRRAAPLRMLDELEEWARRVLRERCGLEDVPPWPDDFYDGLANVPTSPEWFAGEVLRELTCARALLAKFDDANAERVLALLANVAAAVRLQAQADIRRAIEADVLATRRQRRSGRASAEKRRVAGAGRGEEFAREAQRLREAHPGWTARRIARELAPKFSLAPKTAANRLSRLRTR